MHPKLTGMFLSILLHGFQDSVTFGNLREVDRIVYTTSRETCDKRGPLEDDRQWDSEGLVLQSIRSLFTIPIKTFKACKINLKVISLMTSSICYG